MTRAGRRAGGFTLIELLIGMLLLLILMLLGAPAFLRMLERQKAYAATSELAALMRQARLEAVKRGAMSGVTLDYQTRSATAFVDRDANGEMSAGDETIGQVVLPKTIEPWGPRDAAGLGGAGPAGRWLRPQDVAADSPEAINADSCRHVSQSFKNEASKERCPRR